MNYLNILFFSRYATRGLYGYCPQWALNWEYRKKGILDEVRHYSADIIALQEVETDQFYKFFLPELKRDGYEGIFSPKSRAKTMSENDRKHVDGCAIFYRTSKFTLIKVRFLTPRAKRGRVKSKENVQGTFDSDSTCVYSSIVKPNITMKTKKLSIF